MHRIIALGVAALTCAALPAPALAQEQSDDAQNQQRSNEPDLRDVLEELRRLRKRIESLEERHEADQQRIEELESRLGDKPPTEPETQPPDQPQVEDEPPPPLPPTTGGSTPPPPPARVGGQPMGRGAQASSRLDLGGSGLGQGNLLNPEISVFFDMGARLSSSGDDDRNRFNFREAELDLRAAITPFADGVFIVAFGEEIEEEMPGDFEFERKVDIEEGYVDFHSLPWDLSLKVGRFRNNFGRFNRLHTHDLPQVDRPLAVREFLGPEGLITTGGSLSWLVPNPWDKYIELNAEVVNANGGEESPILDGVNADNPAVVGRLKYFDDLGPTATLELGGSYMFARTSESSGTDTNVFGLDATYQWRDPDKPDFRSFLAHGELFYAKNDFVPDMGDPFRNESLGAFLFGQYQFAQNWYAGVRFDYTEFPNAEARGPGDQDFAVSPYISYYLTEFMRLRLQYQHKRSEIAGDWTSENDLLFGLTFSIGAHPTHPYWVNR